MSTTGTQISTINRETFVSARNLAHDGVPWVPLSEGKSFKPLRFLSGNRGFVELLRLEPGEAIPLHRHTGEVHAFNLEGSRQLCTGEVIGPGDYVYEPAGNIDSWEVGRSLYIAALDLKPAMKQRLTCLEPLSLPWSKHVESNETFDFQLYRQLFFCLKVPL